MTGSEIAILWVAIVYWIVDLVRMIRLQQLAGQKISLLVAGVRLTVYAGFIIWFIRNHW